MKYYEGKNNNIYFSISDDGLTVHESFSIINRRKVQENKPPFLLSETLAENLDGLIKLYDLHEIESLPKEY